MKTLILILLTSLSCLGQENKSGTFVVDSNSIDGFKDSQFL